MACSHVRFSDAWLAAPVYDIFSDASFIGAADAAISPPKRFFISV